MKKIFYLIISIAISITFPSIAQQSKLYIKINMLAGVGTRWHTIDFSNGYNNQKIAFSGGGGVGSEMGIGYYIRPKLSIELFGAVQQVLGLQSVNGYTSSVFFNKKVLLTGVKYKFPLNQKAKPLCMKLGGGRRFNYTWAIKNSGK